jgi:SAM-dependent methyltransferase
MPLPINDIIEWDVLNWSELIAFWQPVLDKLDKESKVLAIGERNGGLSIWLALQGFQVVCTDREGPEEQAEILHRKHGVSGRIRYDRLDIVNCDWEKEQFDLIIAKSVIGGLKADHKDSKTRNFEVQRRAVDNIHGLLKKGGYFLSAENMQGSYLLRQIRKMKSKDKGWRYFSWNELPALYGSFQKVDTKGFGIFPTLFSDSLTNKVVFFVNKHVLQWLPNATKYIAFTTAQK